ncbi:MAG: hypothetical protein AB1540_17435, partial [Bdellovibrionota bacterium]
MASLKRKSLIRLLVLDRVVVLKTFLGLLAVFEALGFGLQISEHLPLRYDDTVEYQYVAERLRHFDLSIFWSHNRPPAYPAFLVICEVFGITTSVAAVFLNRAATFLLLFFVPGAAGFVAASAYLWICSSAMLLSYENTVLTESILPFVTVVAGVLGVHALRYWQAKNYKFWALFLSVQFVWLISLKPAYKFFAFFEIFAALSLLQFNRKKALPWVGCVLLVMFFGNNVLFQKSGAY